MILHLVLKSDWEAQPNDKPYRAASLDTEGFIHCSMGETSMLNVANSFYKKQSGEYLVLHIDESKLTSRVKWEAPADPKTEVSERLSTDAGAAIQLPPGTSVPPEVKAEFGDESPTLTPMPPVTPTSTLFPHVYGPINREAIVGLRRFTRADDGTFTGYAQFDDAIGNAITVDSLNPLNVKSASQMANELLDATDEFSESLKRFKDRIEGRMTEIDEKIKKL